MLRKFFEYQRRRKLYPYKWMKEPKRKFAISFGQKYYLKVEWKFRGRSLTFNLKQHLQNIKKHNRWYLIDLNVLFFKGWKLLLIGR